MNGHPSKIACIAGAVLLGGCAVATMSPGTYRQLAAKDAAKIALVSPCCIEWNEVDFRRELASNGIDVDLAQAQVRDFGDHKAPVVGLRLPIGSERHKLEVFSYSDARHGMMRLDNRLFVRPDVFFLDQQYRPVREIKDSPMCWGSHDGGGGLWQRFEIPAGAIYVVLSPSVRIPTQAIDTRKLEGLPPGTQFIADARGKTYNSAVSIGYLGLLSVRAVTTDARPLGRCADPVQAGEART